MKVSKRGVEFIANHEGFRGYAYNDPVNHATVGFGHLLHHGPVTAADQQRWGTKERPKLSREQALKLLALDLTGRETAVDRLVKVKLNQNEFDALVSLFFNIGEGNFQRSTLLKRLNEGNRKAAAEQFAVWNKAGVPLKVLPGLTTRRAAEAKLFLTPVKEKTPVAKPKSRSERLRRGVKNARARLAAALKNPATTVARRRQAKRTAAFWESKLAAFRKRRTVAAASNRLWGGSREITNQVIRIVGKRASVTSRKRWATFGNPGSDHHMSQTTADAVDFGIAEAHSLADEVARKLGGPSDIKDYQNFFITRNGKRYRVQIIAGTHGTGPHLHVGIRRA